MSIGKNIRKYRKENNNKSAKELASKVDLKSAQAILQYEREERQPNIETLIKIASALNISTAQLLDVEELLDEDITTKTINSLFDSFLLDIIVKGDETEYEVKFPELDPFMVTANELHQLEEEIISQIQYWAWKKANHQNTITD